MLKTNLVDVNCVNSTILETITNQEKEEVVAEAISFISEDKRFIWEKLNCLSSKHIDNGNCQCVNHNTYIEEELNFFDVINRIGLEKAKKLVEINKFHLVKRYLQDWLELWTGETFSNLIWCRSEFSKLDLFYKGDRYCINWHYDEEKEVGIICTTTLGEKGVELELEKESFLALERWLAMVDFRYKDESIYTLKDNKKVCDLENFKQYQK